MPGLSCGIIGLPNVGKSTLFNALTKKGVSAENYPFCTINPNIGVVELKDKKLNILAKIFNSKEIIYPTVTFVDIAGLVKGAAKGEGLGNQFLSHIRETDAIIHIVRCFENEKIVHIGGKINPLEDIKIVTLELILADLQTAEKIREKLKKQLKGKKDFKPLTTIEKVISHLNDGQPLTTLLLTDEEKETLKNYCFLTGKKILYVANISEEDLNKENRYVQAMQDYAKKEKTKVVTICAKLEEEIAQLKEDEAQKFLHSLGLQESGLDKLIKEAFQLLNLITFLTAGEKETKAWVIEKGTSAAKAAGKIHTDLEKGFIKAEVISYKDIIKYKGRKEAKEAGKAKMVGGDYIVQNEDVILFYHHK